MQEENLLYCPKLICCVFKTRNSLYTFFLTFEEQNERERGSNINIYVSAGPQIQQQHLLFSPQAQAFRVPLTPRDRREVSIKISAVNHYGSRLLQGSQCEFWLSHLRSCQPCTSAHAAESQQQHILIFLWNKFMKQKEVQPKMLNLLFWLGSEAGEVVTAKIRQKERKWFTTSIFFFITLKSAACSEGLPLQMTKINGLYRRQMLLYFAALD